MHIPKVDVFYIASELCFNGRLLILRAAKENAANE